MIQSALFSSSACPNHPTLFLCLFSLVAQVQNFTDLAILLLHSAIVTAFIMLVNACSTSLRSWDNSTGCPCDSLYCLRPLSSCSNVWPAKHRRTCQTIAGQPVSDSRPHRLRSSDSLTCVVRRAHNTYGDRCFATAGPQVWNSLPIELQQCDSLGWFKWCLKTFLFGSWDYGALWLFVN